MTRAEAQAEVDRLRAKVESYDFGDRPMSPPAQLIRELKAAEAQVRSLDDRFCRALDSTAELVGFTPTPAEVEACPVLAEVSGMPEREAVLELARRYSVSHSEHQALVTRCSPETEGKLLRQLREAQEELRAMDCEKEAAAKEAATARPFSMADAKALLSSARVDAHGAWHIEDVYAAIMKAHRAAFEAGQRHGATLAIDRIDELRKKCHACAVEAEYGTEENPHPVGARYHKCVEHRPGSPEPMTRVAEVLTEMMDRIGGDGVTAALNYDGDDAKLTDELFRLVQDLEKREVYCALYAVLRSLGATEEMLDWYRDSAGNLDALRVEVERFARVPRAARDQGLALAALRRQIAAVQVAERSSLIALGAALTDLFRMAGQGDAPILTPASASLKAAEEQSAHEVVSQRRSWTEEQIREAWYRAQETGRPGWEPRRTPDDLENGWTHVRGALRREQV